MAFQSSVSLAQGFGVPGEMFTDAPWKAETFTIVSSSSALNIIGSTCCTVSAQGFCQAGSAAITRNGTTTSASTSVSGLSATADLVVGSLVQGAGIPAGTTIASITNATTIVLSAAATASATVALIFTPPNFGFAGFLANPKVEALYGTVGAPLAPTLVVPNQNIVECMTMGSLIVSVPAACNIGDSVIFDNATGAISTIAPGAALPNGKTFANAIIDYFTPNGSGAQLAVVAIDPSYVIPQAA